MLAAALLAAAVTATAAQSADDPGWSVDIGSPTAVSSATAEGSFSSPESIRFGEDMRKRALDQLCKSVEIPIDQGLAFDGVGGVSGHLHRSIKTLPNVPGDRLGLIDQVTLGADLGHSFSLGKEGPATFGITVTAHVDAGSMILRPLPSKNSCQELKKLAAVWKIKTVLPPTPERLAAMEVGELWKLPMTLTIGHSEGAAAPAGPFATVSLTLASGQTGSAMMTVYRLSDSATRFRFRVEHVRVKSQNGSISAVYPAALVFSPQGAGLLMKVVDAQITRQISHYLNENLGLFHATSNGQQVLMEFVLDPRKAQDMDALSRALRGDFATLTRMAFKLVTLQANEPAAVRDFARSDANNEAIFGKGGNPGLDLYHDETHGFHLGLPFFFDYSRSKLSRDDRFVRMTDEGGQFDFYREERTTSSGGIDVPLKGQLVKHNTLRSAQAYVYETKDGRVSSPQGVYIYQDGFLRRDAEAVRESALEAADIVALAGARGGASDPRLRAPIDKLLPYVPPPEPDADGREQQRPSYHDGNVSFTLVFTEKAVAEIVNAGAELIARCFRNTLTGRDASLFDLALRTATFDSDGAMHYDYHALRNSFSDENDDRGALSSLCRTVSDIVRDVASIRAAATPQAQAEMLTKILAGKGESGLAYQEILRVLVQLVDPLDVTADLSINVRKGIKDQPDAHAHMTLSKGRPANELLKNAGAVKARFARPSDLVD